MSPHKWVINEIKSDLEIETKVTCTFCNSDPQILSYTYFFVIKPNEQLFSVSH